MEFHGAKAAGLSGVCTERAEYGTVAGAAAAAPHGAFKRQWTRAPACGSGADVQAAGHTPGRPVDPHEATLPTGSEALSLAWLSAWTDIRLP
jgi:hypothetical protein